MIIESDFKSEEALYLQVRNQIIHGIATLQLQEGDELPSVRQMADEIGINMHTVNKAYTVLKQEGFRVEEGVCGIATAFAASFGSGRPHIGILAEYDALSGLSQQGGQLAGALQLPHQAGVRRVAQFRAGVHKGRRVDDRRHQKPSLSMAEAVSEASAANLPST